jgi:TolB-like protein/DNA-binding winged helix-turn-helix (wHTH) protein/Tfp pilus assembly protein PilF
VTADASGKLRCFGPFRLNVETGELWKRGTKIRLQGQALQILLCLLEEPGRFRTREELRSRLWPNGTFVDFDHSLNVAVNRLRERLEDSAENPHYIETVPGVGYRFLVPVETAQAPASESRKGRQEPAAEPAGGKRRIAGLAMASSCMVLAAAVGGLIWNRFAHPAAETKGPQIDSIAVLPLASLGRDGGDEYFADGMTEELITELARMGSFRVISRTSIMRYKRTVRPLPEIGHELNVKALVEGTVRRSGDRVRITVQLIRTSPEQHIWADAFEGDIRDVLNLQRDVARDIVDRIQSKIGTQPMASSVSNKRLDPETYEDYLRGRYFLARRNREAMSKAVGYFEQAVRRDPQYAQAYSGLAIAYDLLGTYELLSPDKSFPKVKEFASKALSLDNTLSEAYTARATAASFWEFNWQAAERDFQRAIALDPNSAIAHHWYGEHLINIGKAERAISELKRARVLDPLSLPVNSTLGRVYRDARRYTEAVEQCKKTLELDPNFSMGHWCLGQAYVGERQYSTAIPELEHANRLGTTPLMAADLGFAYAAVGRNAEAKTILLGLERKAQSDYVPPYLIATIHGALRERDEAFKWLERAYDERDSHITYLALDPEMDPLRSDPRFPPLMRRLRIPP